MKYAEMLKNGIDSSKLSLSQVCLRLMKKNIILDKAVLSKMQNGKIPPAKDVVNVALADILGIDSTQFRLAAAREQIPKELYQLIREAG